MDSNFKFYRQITDNADFAEDLLTWMLGRYRKAKKGQADALCPGMVRRKIGQLRSSISPGA